MHSSKMRLLNIWLRQVFSFLCISAERCSLKVTLVEQTSDVQLLFTSALAANMFKTTVLDMFPRSCGKMIGCSMCLFLVQFSQKDSHTKVALAVWATNYSYHLLWGLRLRYEGNRWMGSMKRDPCILRWLWIRCWKVPQDVLLCH